jgi:outer membrane biosynthesis protein TonB
MKKNAIALLLSVVLAAGSIGGPAVYAAESGSTAEESEAVEADEFALDEKAVEIEEVSDDEAVESAEEAQTEEEPAEEEPAEEEPTEEEPTEKESAAEDSVAAESTEPESAEKVSAGDAASEYDSAEAEERTGQAPGEKEDNDILEETAADERNEAAGGIAASGTCGDNAIWELDEAGVMTVSGDGPMTDYRNGA